MFKPEETPEQWTFDVFCDMEVSETNIVRVVPDDPAYLIKWRAVAEADGLQWIVVGKVLVVARTYDQLHRGIRRARYAACIE